MKEQEELKQEENYLSFTQKLAAGARVIVFSLVILATGILMLLSI